MYLILFYHLPQTSDCKIVELLCDTAGLLFFEVVIAVFIKEQKLTLIFSRTDSKQRKAIRESYLHSSASLGFK